MAVPVTAIGVLLALVFPVPAELLVLAFDVVFAGCLVPLVLGVYWKRGSARAAFFAIVIPSVIRLALHYLVTDLWKDPRFNGLQTLLPPLISLIIFVLITLYDENRRGRIGTSA
jgi:Na+/pantothenate symporter